jgi:hypothetical protein
MRVSPFWRGLIPAFLPALIAVVLLARDYRPKEWAIKHQ